MEIVSDVVLFVLGVGCGAVVSALLIGAWMWRAMGEGEVCRTPTNGSGS